MRLSAQQFAYCWAADMVLDGREAYCQVRNNLAASPNSSVAANQPSKTKKQSDGVTGGETKILFVLRFYGPVNPMGSCRARSVYLTTRLLGRLSPLSG